MDRKRVRGNDSNEAASFVRSISAECNFRSFRLFGRRKKSKEDDGRADGSLPLQLHRCQHRGRSKIGKTWGKSVEERTREHFCRFWSRAVAVQCRANNNRFHTDDATSCVIQSDTNGEIQPPPPSLVPSSESSDRSPSVFHSVALRLISPCSRFRFLAIHRFGVRLPFVPLFGPRVLKK